MPRRKRLDTTPEWKALKAHAAQLKGASLRELFAADAARAQAFSLEVGGWYLDYSKNLATAETLQHLMAAQVPLVAPIMGERLDIRQPALSQQWWRAGATPQRASAPTTRAAARISASP